jgi:hypothetical protein
MSICFSLAQDPLDLPHPQTLALAKFDLVNKKKFDLSGDASKGAVWKAGAKGLEALSNPSLKSKGVLFLAEHHFGLYPTYAMDTKFMTYEALLNGQRYAITFVLAPDGSVTAAGWVPFSVQKITEFTAVKSNIGPKKPPAPSVALAPLDAPGAFYQNVGQNVGQAPAETGFYMTPPKVIQGSGTIASGPQQPSPKMVGPIIASGI